MKLYLRKPMAAFFTLAYAPMILFIFGFIYGNEPAPLFGGRGYIDSAVPSFMALIITSLVFFIAGLIVYTRYCWKYE